MLSAPFDEEDIDDDLGAGRARSPERSDHAGITAAALLPGDRERETVLKAAYRQGLALVLKGPTGCGKTRFVEAMAYDLGRPLITVSCHDDLTTADLVGRYLLQGDQTVWVDGPLTLSGA